MRCRETDLNPIFRLHLIRPMPKRCGRVRRYAYNNQHIVYAHVHISTTLDISNAYVNVHDSSIWAMYVLNTYHISRLSPLFGVHELFIQCIHSSRTPNWGIILIDTEVSSRLTTRRKYELKDPPSRRSQAVRNGVKTPCLIASVSVTPGLHLAVT